MRYDTFENVSYPSLKFMVNFFFSLRFLVLPLCTVALGSWSVSGWLGRRTQCPVHILERSVHVLSLGSVPRQSSLQPLSTGARECGKPGCRGLVSPANLSADDESLGVTSQLQRPPPRSGGLLSLDFWNCFSSFHSALSSCSLLDIAADHTGHAVYFY